MGIEKYITVTLEVREAPDFFPSANNNTQSVHYGDMAVYSFYFVPNTEFNGMVRFSAVTPGVIATWDVTDISVGQTATCTIDSRSFGVGNFSIDFKSEEI